MVVRGVSSAIDVAFTAIVPSATRRNDKAEPAQDGLAAPGADDVQAGDRIMTSTTVRISPLGKFAASSETEKAGGGKDPIGDSIDAAIKLLQRQLEKVMQQIQRVAKSNIPADQKATSLQALNGQAAAIQGQIVYLMQKKLEQMQGES